MKWYFWILSGILVMLILKGRQIYNEKIKNDNNNHEKR